MYEDNVQPIGQVLHYFDRLGVAVLQMWDGLALGDWVYFYGNVTNFAQPIDSMQIDHQPLEEFFAEEGQEVEVAIKVVERVRAGDYIYAYYPDDDHTG